MLFKNYFSSKQQLDEFLHNQASTLDLLLDLSHLQNPKILEYSKSQTSLGWLN